MKNSDFWHFDHLLGQAGDFFGESNLTSESSLDPLSNKLSIIEKDQEIRKLSLYRLIRPILTKFATFEEMWPRPRKERGLKCIFFGISVQNSINLYDLFLGSRDFFQMRTLWRLFESYKECLLKLPLLTLDFRIPPHLTSSWLPKSIFLESIFHGYVHLLKFFENLS